MHLSAIISQVCERFLRISLANAQLVGQVGSPLEDELLVIPLIENLIASESPLDDRRRHLCQSRAVSALDALAAPRPGEISVVRFLDLVAVVLEDDAGPVCCENACLARLSIRWGTWGRCRKRPVLKGLVRGNTTLGVCCRC